MRYETDIAFGILGYYIFAMSIKEIEKAVSQLPPNELSEFSTWFEDYLSEQWERQFEQDVASGKLDHIAKKADQDFEAGRCTPL